MRNTLRCGSYYYWTHRANSEKCCANVRLGLNAREMVRPWSIGPPRWLAVDPEIPAAANLASAMAPFPARAARTTRLELLATLLPLRLARHDAKLTRRHRPIGILRFLASKDITTAPLIVARIAYTPQLAPSALQVGGSKFRPSNGAKRRE